EVCGGRGRGGKGKEGGRQPAPPRRGERGKSVFRSSGDVQGRTPPAGPTPAWLGAVERDADGLPKASRSVRKRHGAGAARNCSWEEGQVEASPRPISAETKL